MILKATIQKFLLIWVAICDQIQFIILSNLLFKLGCGYKNVRLNLQYQYSFHLNQMNIIILLIRSTTAQAFSYPSRLSNQKRKMRSSLYNFVFDFAMENNKHPYI